MKTLFYRRNGSRVSRALVRKSRMAFALSKRTGKLGELTVSIQPAIAAVYEKMTEEEYGTFTGSFTYRRIQSQQ